MNDKFFSLPEEKQLAIINAGYRVFSQNSYKKSPMSEIAAEAGISKSLLFHYFKNKREAMISHLTETAPKGLDGKSVAVEGLTFGFDKYKDGDNDNGCHPLKSSAYDFINQCNITTRNNIIINK